MRIGVLGALALLFAAGLTASPMMTTPAHAAYGPCNTTVKRASGILATYTVPARTDNGTSCYMQYHTGSENAVKVLQLAILRCYSDTYAANRIRATGGADGFYGTGTVDAVRWLQSMLGVSADGVYGPATRNALKWPAYWQDPMTGDDRMSCDTRSF
ncbi:peptidoglycan-binding protein [Streptomyces sp. NBC_00878]|uniref:peptidoglycan-binding domain-containing protein n=1 Tax=Streptomyces sp. NBC_00878 TaxID=2975854 RepID=UPI0022545B10|nr:peptidoglycan-binding domain-containing protein [Streptomyces sp. NBC_00878]MCX4908385.1 peptidoglycan-binding protein [Streptomyces sp. NBC_00878]